MLWTSNSTDEEEARLDTPTTLNLVEQSHSQLQCAALGGNPPPQLTISLGDYIDISHRMVTETFTQLRGNVGVKVMHSRVHKWTNDFVVTDHDDGKILSCSAKVPGLPPNITSTVVRVQCK